MYRLYHELCERVCVYLKEYYRALFVYCRRNGRVSRGEVAEVDAVNNYSEHVLRVLVIGFGLRNREVRGLMERVGYYLAYRIRRVGEERLLLTAP